MTRKLSLKVTPLLLGSVLAAGLGISSNAQADELRIGYIAPVTGIFAQVGKDMVNGFQLYLDEHGGKLGGADVKFIVEDDQGKPDTGVTKAKKLILQDHVHMFIGGLLASSGYALAPVSTAEKTLYISSISSADDLTQRQLSKYPYFLRTSWTSSLPHQPLGQWACDQGYKTAVAIAADYAFGYETVGGFQKVFEDCGGKVIQKIWPPLGTKDFGPYIPTMKKADIIFTTMVGPMALQFPKQLRAAGNKTADRRERRQLRRIRAAVHGRRSDRRRLRAALQRGARDAGEREIRQGLPRQIRQGAVLLFREQLHHGACGSTRR